MSSKLNILESKKLFKEFNYLMSDVDFKNEFIIEYAKSFEEDIRTALIEEPLLKQSCKDKFGDILNPNENLVQKEEIVMSDSTDVIIFTGQTISYEPIIKLEHGNQKIKDLYRKIVQKTHPDKIKSDTLNEFYVKATEANKNGDILSMYSICNELRISFEISNEEVAGLKHQINIIKSHQFNFERGHMWAWVHEQNKDRKREIIRHLLINYAPSVATLFTT